MDSEKIAGILGAIVAAIVLAAAFVFVPPGQIGKPAQPAQKTQAPAQPTAPVVKGPVIREVPQ